MPVALLAGAEVALDAARQNIEEALSIFRQADDEAGRAWSLQLLGLVLAAEGQYELADRAMQDGMAIAQKLGDLNKSSFALAFLGDVVLQQGDRARAKRVYEECADSLHRLGNKIFGAYPPRWLAYLALERNEMGPAWRYFSESLQLNRESGDRRGAVASLAGMAALAVQVNKPLTAARLLGVVESRLESLNTYLLDSDRAEMERVRSKLATTLDEATLAAAVAEGWGMGEEEVDEVVEELGA